VVVDLELVEAVLDPEPLEGVVDPEPVEGVEGADLPDFGCWEHFLEACGRHTLEG
jgi:hypothetical protein